MLAKDVSPSVLRCADSSRVYYSGKAQDAIPHIVICNALGVGHYHPASVFAMLLASSSVPLFISFFAVARKSEDAKCIPINESDNVAFRKYVLEGPDVHPITMNAMITRKEALVRELESFVQKNRQKRQWGPVTAIVHDPFALFAREWGIAHDIACVIFNPSNAFFWGLMKTDGLMMKVMEGCDNIEVHPSVPKIRGQLMWSMMQKEANTAPEDKEPVLKYFAKMEDMFNHACAVVGNDIHALYPWAIERVIEGYQNMWLTKAPAGFSKRASQPFRYYSVAPLCVTSLDTAVCEDLGKINGEISLKYWLDQKEEKSVIFVALGTLYKMEREVIQALFESLKHCPFSFVWSYRELHSPPAITPSMLASLPLEKGVVLPWVHQKYLLMHPALRLFISHCGWNSTLENMCYGGLPTMCVPLGSDQFVNTILLCDILRCARIGMIQAEDWSETAMREQSKCTNPAQGWASGSRCAIKYKFPSRSVEFSRLIRETADLHYNDLLLRAKEVQIQALKAGAHRGSMILNIEDFAKFVTDLKEVGTDVEDEEYERQRSRVLLMMS